MDDMQIFERPKYFTVEGIIVTKTKFLFIISVHIFQSKTFFLKCYFLFFFVLFCFFHFFFLEKEENNEFK